MSHIIRRPLASLPLVLMALAVLAAACGGGDSSNADPASVGGSDQTNVGGAATQGDISISGSSTVEPISIRVAELFAESRPG